MTNTQENNWQQEWQILHNNYEQYEHKALLIKMLALVICTIGLISPFTITQGILLLATLWLQEGIWKTYQTRIGKQLLLIEAKMYTVANETETTETAKITGTTPTKTINQPFQFYTLWQDKRSGIIGLLSEYLLNALRPTVIYPYAILIVIMAFIM